MAGATQKMRSQRQPSKRKRDVETEGGPEVLGHDVDEARCAGGPVDADEAEAEAHALREACALNAAADTDVFDDLHAEGLIAADLEVGGPAEKVKGAEADGVAFCFGVGDAPGAPPPEAKDL